MNQRHVCTLLLTLILQSGTTQAGILDPGVFTGTPVNSWAYSELVSAGHGESVTYFPTSTSEWAGAAFQGYVLDPNEIVPVGWYGDGFDTMQVFTTYVYSPTDVVIDLQIGGDDGHSLFVDDAFITGGGFGATLTHTLSLTGGVAKKLTMAGYNGPGNWVFGFAALDSNNDPIPIAGYAPGVVINADGDFAVVPEPSTAVMLGSGVFLIGLYRRRRVSPNR